MSTKYIYILETDSGKQIELMWFGQWFAPMFKTFEKAQEAANTMMEAYKMQKEQCDKCGKLQDDKLCDKLLLDQEGRCQNSPEEQYGDLYEVVRVCPATIIDKL